MKNNCLFFKLKQDLTQLFLSAMCVSIPLPRWLSGKNLTANAGNLGSIPGLGRSSGEGNGNPLKYFCLGNPMDREAWQATVRGVTKSQTQLRNQTKTNNCSLLFVKPLSFGLKKKFSCFFCILCYQKQSVDVFHLPNKKAFL